MVVMLVAIVLFSVINFEAMWLNLVVRIALMPLVAGLSYEVIRYAAKKESGAIFKFMTLPGLARAQPRNLRQRGGHLAVEMRVAAGFVLGSALAPRPVRTAPSM